MTIPTFFIVGAEKCGTTALHRHLSRHPQIFMSEPKEPSFFLAEDHRYVTQDLGGMSHSPIRTLEEYESLFATAADAKEIGESSPCYIYSDVAPHRIKAKVPDARIIAILRNPMERAYSQFVFNQQLGWESHRLTFADALALEEERVEKNSMWAFHYTRRGMYSKQVGRYLDLFGNNRVRIVLYDDFVREPEKVLDEIYDFLGVDHITLENPRELHNVSGLPKSRLLHHITHTPNPLKSLLKSILPNKVRQQIQHQVRSRNLIKPPASPDDLAHLKDVFETDIHALDRIIEPNTSVWLDK